MSCRWYYSLFDNAETNLTEFLANQAQMGMNTMMLYTFPLQMFHGEQWAAQQKQALDAADAIGMKILMDIEGCENGVSVYFLHTDEINLPR